MLPCNTFLPFLLLALLFLLRSGEAIFQQNAFYFPRQSGGQLYSELTRSRANDDRIDTLYFMSYSLSSRGNGLIGSLDQVGEDLAKQFSVKRLVGFDNANQYDYDPARVRPAIGKFSARIISGIAFRARNYDGVILDFENLPRLSRRAYSTFLGRLKASLNALKKNLTVTVPCVSNDWNTGYDIAAIGRVADNVLVMAWDEFYTRPGPVSSLPWIQRCTDFVKQRVPLSKIIVGLPTYGYEYGVTFPKRKIKGLGWIEIDRLLRQQNIVNVQTSLNGPLCAPSTNYSIAYPNNMFVTEVIWHETYESILQKTKYIKDSQFAGVGIYALGLDSPRTWDAVMEA